MLRGLHRKEVGQRRKLLVGETLRQLVQEADIVARRRAFVPVDLLALLTAAVGEIAVVLAYGDDVHAGVGPEDRIDFRRHQFEEFVVGETPLAGAAGTTFAVDERVVFGMLRAVDRRRKQAVEGVHPQAAGKDVARLLQTQGQPVHGVLRHAVALTLAIAERRIFDEVHRRKRDGRIPVEVIDPGGEVIQPQVTFQQRHDAINRPLVAAAADAQHAVLRTQAEAVLGKSRGVRSADQDVALAGRHVMQQGQCRTGRFADESLQQLRGREIGGSLLRHDDPGRRFAVAGQPGLRPDSGRDEQQRHNEYPAEESHLFAVLKFESQPSAPQQLVVADAVSLQRFAAERHRADIDRAGIGTLRLDDEFPGRIVFPV